jgi:acyl carrier protein phosphodiesterase
MNFLAHIYLSGDSDLIKIGNFMADGVRGNKHLELHSDIQKGIILHRFIDTFTDAHPLFRQSTKRLHANYHHFSGVIVDVFYDHFLAKNWHLYSDEKLEDYVATFYESLDINHDLLTEKAQLMKPYMIQQNWLLSYRTIEGIEKILSQMDNRIKRESNMRLSVQELRLFYQEFEDDFTIFFEDLQLITKHKLTELLWK